MATLDKVKADIEESKKEVRKSGSFGFDVDGNLVVNFSIQKKVISEDDEMGETSEWEYTSYEKTFATIEDFRDYLEAFLEV